MAYFLAPAASARPQFFDSQGAVLAGGKLYWYLAGTTTPEDTYTDSTGATANANPIVLDSAGRPATGIYLEESVSYKLVVHDSSGNTVFTQDNVVGISTTPTPSEWVSSGLTATYISATQFSVPGDQTTDLHKRRRLKIVDAGGTKYASITASAYTTLTTVTVEVDAGGSLQTPITSVSWSLVTATNPSIDSDMVHRKSSDAVATAATCDIWAIQGDYVHLTGTTTVTSLGTAPYAGAQRTLIADGAFVLTHNATTLQCPGGRDIPVQAGDRILVRADTTANMIVVDHKQALVNSVLLEIARSGRLTLETGVPVSTSDQTAKTTVYFTPMDARFTELSQATTDSTKSPAAVTTDSNYDVFLWMDAGTLRATRGPAWSSATARGTGAGTTELATANGVRVNANAITNGPGAQAGIYLGTIRSDGSSQINDSVLLRGVWNMFNRRLRHMAVTDATNSWTYTTAAYRQANASTANQVSLVRGLDEDAVEAHVLAFGDNGGANAQSVGIGIDSSTVNSAQIRVVRQSTAIGAMQARYVGLPGIGWRDIRWLEFSVAAGTSTWYGDNNGTGSGQSGLVATAMQ